MRKTRKLFYRWEKPYYIRGKCIRCKKKINKEKEELPSTRTGLSEGKLFRYPTVNKSNDSIFTKTFLIKYNGTLSKQAKSTLNRFKNKYVYHAIDDILYFCHSEIDEKEKLKTFLYSSMISLQNDFSVNFFDIWIDSIYFTDIKIENSFLKNDPENQFQFTQITLKLFYIIRPQSKKVDSLW